MQFPEYRPRRLRRTESLRRLIRETQLARRRLHLPDLRHPRPRPAQADLVAARACRRSPSTKRSPKPRKRQELGIPAVILFGVPDKKDAVGSEAWNDDGLVQQATRAIKKACPELTVMLDACFDEYTTHGHCGVVVDGDVDNDATLENLGRVALSQARAGADIIAPSGMMDGFVGWIRESLDEEGFEHLPIMAYSAKYASCFYGPFREAAGTASRLRPPQGLPDGSGQRPRSDPRGHARRRRRRRHHHGQAGARLPRRHRARARRDRSAASPPTTSPASTRCSRPPPSNGWIDHDRAVLETLTSIKRAGADMILTYHAKEAARLLKRG